jgi:hypothetical protein
VNLGQKAKVKKQKSKSASFTTGQTIFVCGGASISQQHF